MSMERVVYFTVDTGGRKNEVARFTNNISPGELKELFRSAAEAGPRDILKLYNSTGQLVNISPNLFANTPETPYKLVVVAAHCNGMLLSNIPIDLPGLEERVARLEKQLHAECQELPPSVLELKTRVDSFKEKLENTEHLSWLGFYKDMPSPLFTDACKNLRYRRKSDVQKQQVREKFLNICDVSISEEVRQCLRQPSFDCCQWEDEEILVLLQQMYLDLDFPTTFGIDIKVLRNFLFEVYKNYNEIPFHNFRHCFCVAQMMYAIVWCVNLPSKIGDLETMILLTSCICHDLDHPGYNNIYQINAKTELALRYNDISPLENHHCSIAFRILENPEYNIFKSLQGEAFRQVREGIIRCILATDMARHNEILAQFKEITPEFDFTNKAHTNLLSMVLIKVADISNEARPMDVAEPWLDRLLEEFFKQSDAEKLEGLPVTPFMDREKITKPSSQCSFIGFVLLPLFEALGELFTELQDLIVQPVRDALDYYRRLNEAAKDERLHRKSLADVALGSNDSVMTSGDSSQAAIVKSTSAHSVKSRRSLPMLSVRSRSRSTGDEGEELVDGVKTVEENVEEDEVLQEEEEEDDEEVDQTITEVEVSEKTLKFKISTEGTVGSGRKSYPGSRKGSRERGQLHEYAYSDLARAVKEREKEWKRSDSTNRDPNRVTSMSPVSSQGSDGFLLNLQEENPEDCVASPDNSCKDVCNGKAHCSGKDIQCSSTNDVEEKTEPKSNADLHSCQSEACDTSMYQSVEVHSENNLTVKNGAEDEEGNENSIINLSSHNHHHHHPSHKSLFSRLRSFADKLSFSGPTEKNAAVQGRCKFISKSLKSSSTSSESFPTTPKHRGTSSLKDHYSTPGESQSTSSLTSESESKALTLPKAKKTPKQNGSQRGWRLLMSSNKNDMPSSSPELISESRSPAHESKKNFFRIHKNLCGLGEESKTFNKHKNIQELQDESENAEIGYDMVASSGEEKLYNSLASDFYRKGNSSFGGSLDSVLQEKKPKSTNNNHKKSENTNVPSKSKRGSIFRLGKSDGDEAHSPVMKTHANSHNWMSTLAAGLRGKKTQELDNTKLTTSLLE